MAVISDMVLTVAVIPIALGAVAELQVRVGEIRPAAYGAAVGVGSLGGGDSGLVGPGSGEGDNLGALAGGPLLLSEQPPEVRPPGDGDHIDNVLAEEQEIVGQCHQGEQVQGEQEYGDREDEHIVERQHQVQQGEDPCLHRDHIQQQEMGIGVHGSVGQEQAQVQVGDVHILAQ